MNWEALINGRVVHGSQKVLNNWGLSTPMMIVTVSVSVGEVPTKISFHWPFWLLRLLRGRQC